MTKRIIRDAEVAEFLASFRERIQGEQERSPVWQELVSFPGWGMAKFTPELAKIPIIPTAELPDPRMTAQGRADFVKGQEGAVTDEGKGKPTPGAMTSVAMPGGVNPWADVRRPTDKGPVFLASKTDVPPPFPGAWEKREGGWFRKE
jgi:hypothetical protein